MSIGPVSLLTNALNGNNNALNNSQISQLSQSLFQQIDTNGDGQVSQSEFTSAIQSQLSALQQAFQSNGPSGVQDYLNSIQNTPQGQMLALLMPQLFGGASGTGQLGAYGMHHHHHHGAGGVANRAAENAIQQNDTNGDGQLSASELPGLSQTAFQQLDTNGDGQLSQSEIQSAVKSQLSSLLQAYQSGGTTGVQDYLNSIQNTPNGEILQTFLPQLFGSSSQTSQTASTQSSQTTTQSTTSLQATDQLMRLLEFMQNQGQTSSGTGVNVAGLNINTSA